MNYNDLILLVLPLQLKPNFKTKLKPNFETNLKSH